MATWKKVIVSGSNAHLASVTASAGVLVGTNQQITTLPDTTFLSGSFSGSFQGSFAGNIQSATSASYINVVTASSGTPTNAHYLTFVDSDNPIPGLYEQLYTDSGITYTPSTDLLTVSGDLAVNGGDITTNQATFNLLAGATTTLNIGASTTTASFGGTVVIAGGLDVNGTVTTIDTENLLVADQFILLGSGSVANKDGGIIIQSAAAAGSGFAYFLDDTTNPRWAFSSSVASTATSVTPDEYVVSAKSVGGTWTAGSPAPTYGGTTAGYGNIVIDSADIWIYA